MLTNHIDRYRLRAVLLLAKIPELTRCVDLLTLTIEQSSSKVVAAIELDDKSHQKRENIRRDKDKNYALSSAGIKLFRVKTAKNYSNAISEVLAFIRLNPAKSNDNQGLFSGLLKKVRE